MFKKRQGTSGILGHLYETKLLSLILFRAQHDNNIREFYLATNIANIGVFDDICFKAKLNEDRQPLMAFIQAKHSKSTIGTLNKKSNLVKYFNSYITIKRKFDPTTEDCIFNEEFNETECFFVVYTIEESCKSNINIKNPPVLNNLVATGPVQSQPLYGEKNVQLIAKIITATVLAQSFAQFLYDKYEVQCITFRDLKNDIIFRYHVILAKEVVDVTEIVNGNQRKCHFRQEFFNTTDTFLSLFRDSLYIEILKKQKVDKITRERLLLEFLAQPSEDTLRPVIGKMIVYDDGQFKFVQKRTSLALREELRQIYLPPTTVKLVTKQAALNILQSSDTGFMVPSTFGNIDLEEKNIKNLVFKIGNLFSTAVSKVTSEGKTIQVVTINETESDKIIVLNRDLGSTVGNILIHDDGEYLGNRYLKFIENDSLLKPNVKMLLKTLNCQFKNIEEYRFDVKHLQFPKLTHDYVDEGLIREFLSKLILYTGQASQSGVDNILKQLIQTRQIIDTCNFRIKSEAIFLKYHDKIQSWSISSSEEIPYLTKARNIYQEAVDNIVNDQLMTITSMMYMHKIKVNYTFSENTIKSLCSWCNVFTKQNLAGDIPAVIIITDSASLTVIKITSFLKTQYIVLDLYHILEMLPDDFYALISELESENLKETFIIVCDLDNFETSDESYRIHDKIKRVAGLVNKKKRIIITNTIISKTISKYFQPITKTYTESHSLVDFKPESQKNILENCQVSFQDQNVNLNRLIEGTSMIFLKGKVLNEIIFTKRFILGDSLTDTNYDSIAHLYVDRKLSHDETSIELQTLHSVQGDVVLLTGKPGMGKSTLLTHLSLKTKEQNKRLWIAKINLLEHSGELRDLRKKSKTIDVPKVLRFVCLVLLKIKKQLREFSLDINNLQITLNRSDNEVYLEEFSGDQWAKFELEMFIHFYNKGNVVFLFDGFDEVCPHYKNTVITLINILREDIQQKKKEYWLKWLPWPQIWITCRSYNELRSVLQNHFSSPYELENFSVDQLNIYLDTFWQSNLIISKCNKALIDKIKLSLDNTSTKNIVNNFTLSPSLSRVQGSFISYLITNIPGINDTGRWCNLYRTIKFLRQYIPDMTDTTYNYHEVECPLLTSLLANYFVKYLTDPEESNPTNSFNFEALTVYKWLIEALIQKHYKDKKKMDLDISYNIIDYETKLPGHIEMYKKMAVYAIFQNDIHNIFDCKELSNIEFLIDTVKKGEEVTGLTTCVLNNIPQFLQMTFAQYLAAEFLFDLFQCVNMKSRRRKQLNIALYNQIDSFCVWLNHKLEMEGNFIFQVVEFVQ